MSTSAQSLQDNLAQFFGGGQNYFDRMFPKVHYTEGIKFARDNGMNWLCVDVMANVSHKPKMRTQRFIVVKANPETGKVSYYGDPDANGDDVLLYEEEYMGMDLDREQVLFVSWITSDIQLLMLSNEY